jgi:hypothetical protein
VWAPLSATYLKVLVDDIFRVFGVFVQLEQVLALLGKAAWEKVGEESLDCAKDKDMSERTKRNQ